MSLEYSKETVAFKDTGAFKQIVLDYISGQSDLRSFYGEPNKLANIPKGIVERSQFDKQKRATLVEVLREQNAKGMSAATKANLDKLAKSTCFTITTGHQLNLFTGPLYTIYKIVHCIKLAKACQEKYADHQFVPVFWMHTEDHDIEEINHFYLFDKKTTWSSADSGVAGELPTETLMILLFQLKEVLGDSVEEKEILKMLETSYTGETNLADATRHFVNTLFGDLGLIIIDPRDKRLKQQFKSVFQDDLTVHRLYDKVKDASDKLNKYGYKAQALPRSINTFYMHNGIREKILYLNQVKKYQLETSGDVLEKDDLMKLIEEHPERFSPNVFLRPMYQEFILPNLVYIGGGGEIAYWLQLKSAFEQFNVPFPMLAVRSSVMWIDAKSNKKLEGFNLTSADFFGDTDALLNKVTRGDSTESLLEVESKDLEKIFDRILTKAKEINPAMEKTVMGEFKKQFKAIQNLEGKIFREVKRKNETELSRLRKMKEKFFPNNGLQERRNNIVEYWSRYGRDWLEVIVEELDPLDDSFLVLTEK